MMETETLLDFNAIMTLAFSDGIIEWEAMLSQQEYDPGNYHLGIDGEHDEEDAHGATLTHDFRCDPMGDEGTLAIEWKGDGFSISTSLTGAIDAQGDWHQDNRQGYDMRGTNLEAFARFMGFTRDDYVACVDAMQKTGLIDQVEASLRIIAW